MMTVDQVMAAQKANVETLFNLTNTAFSSIEKLVELNIAVARHSLTEAAENMQTALSAKDAQELIAMQANLMQPLAEKAMVYGRQLYEIASNSQAEFNKVAESKSSEAQQALMSFVDNASKNAPAGSEASVALVKTAMATANNAVESIQKASKQALNMVEANYEAVSKQVVNASQAAANQAKTRPVSKK